MMQSACRRWANVTSAGQKGVGPTLAAKVEPTDVPMLDQHCLYVGMLSVILKHI